MKYKIIGILIIGVASIFLLIENINQLSKVRTEIKLINNIDYKNPTNEYIGYISIPKINIKKIIKYGSSKEILDESYVGILNGKTLENKNIVLAGHNNKNVFNRIRYLEIGDEVILNTVKSTKYYKVYDIIKIELNEFKYFYDTEENLLTLITCTDQNHKRLIVICKLYYEKVL